RAQVFAEPVQFVEGAGRANRIGIAGGNRALGSVSVHHLIGDRSLFGRFDTLVEKSELVACYFGRRSLRRQAAFERAPGGIDGIGLPVCQCTRFHVGGLGRGRAARGSKSRSRGGTRRRCLVHSTGLF